jgi:hypothetical protein
MSRHLNVLLAVAQLPFKPWPIGIVTLKNRTLSPAAQLFIECAREVARPLAKGRAKSAGN